MKISRWLILAGVVAIAAVLALRLSGVVYAMLVLPVSYLLWLMKLLYRAMPGDIWWSLLILAVLFIFAMSLVPDVLRIKGRVPPRKPSMGGVETLSRWMEKSQTGIYYKWLVANRLGRIAHRLLEQRAAENKRFVSDRLAGPGWTPLVGVQAYLESGLQGSFADHARSGNFLSKPAPTPLNHDVTEVVEYLESQQGDRHS